MLRSDAAQTALADVDWRVFKALYEAKRRRPLLDEIQVQTNADGRATTRGAEQTQITQRLKGLSPQQRRGALSAWIQGEVAAILRLADGKLPDPNKGFFKLGMDSLMAVELATRLKKSMGRTLPTTLAFDFPTVNQLAEHLAGALQCEKIEVNDHEVADDGARTQSSTIDDIAALGYDDVSAAGEDIDRLLVEKLVRLESLMGET